MSWRCLGSLWGQWIQISGRQISGSDSASTDCFPCASCRISFHMCHLSVLTTKSVDKCYCCNFTCEKTDQHKLTKWQGLESTCPAPALSTASFCFFTYNPLIITSVQSEVGFSRCKGLPTPEGTLAEAKWPSS